MMHLWILLLFLHQGCSLISVTRVQLGEPVTFTCSFPDWEASNTRVKWYKQSIGDTLKLITTLMKGTTNATLEKGFSPSKFAANYSRVKSTLTIFKTVQDDEALYHCGVFTWGNDHWTGEYLSLNEKNKRTSNYDVVQWPTVSDQVLPGDSVTLQCSIHSKSGSKSCSDVHSVHWFGVKSQSFDNIIYTDRRGPFECDRKPKESSPSRGCVYHFSKNITSLDSGTYYCALATCGEIIFGNGTKIDVKETSWWSFGVLQDSLILLLFCFVLAVSVTVIAILIYIIKKNECDSCKAAALLQENVAKRNFKREENTLIYSAAIFTMINADNGRKRNTKSIEREKLYAAVKAFGMD
ncbi:uncharacterized protein KZ484_008789 [Pholidichthys leucotaenia]